MEDDNQKCVNDVTSECENSDSKASDNDIAAHIMTKDIEIATLKDTVLRKTAEFENARKRMEKEKDDACKYANAKFSKDLLAVIDNFERVTEMSANLKNKIDADQNIKAFFDGIMLCEKELLNVLKKHGVNKINLKPGDAFDHQYHQAMCEIESDEYNAGQVAQVMQSGYIHHDRLLRPAMVSVVKK